jgi:CheY-like chemotaxis protein
MNPVAPPNAQATVLVVDDTVSILKLHATILAHAGYRVLTTTSGVEAIDLLATDIPDVIVLDYMMPVMDGPMFLRRMRSDVRLGDVAVILLTASSDELHVEEAFAAGANEYLTKPVDRRVLLARVRAMVDARRARQELRMARVG